VPKITLGGCPAAATSPTLLLDAGDTTVARMIGTFADSIDQDGDVARSEFDNAISISVGSSASLASSRALRASAAERIPLPSPDKILPPLATLGTVVVVLPPVLLGLSAASDTPALTANELRVR